MPDPWFICSLHNFETRDPDKWRNHILDRLLAHKAFGWAECQECGYSIELHNIMTADLNSVICASCGRSNDFSETIVGPEGAKLMTVEEYLRIHAQATD